MEQNETKVQSANQSGDMNDAPADAPSREGRAGRAGRGTCTCGRPAGSCACGGGQDYPPDAAVAPSYVYALGRVEARFPSLSVEREVAQVAGRSETAGLTDRQALHAVLSRRENRYLARQLCYILSVEGVETYVLLPRDSADFELLVEAVRPAPRPTDVDAVIGVRGPLAPPQMCNGLTVPIVAFDQMYSFDIDSLIKAIPRPEKMGAKEFAQAAEELLIRVMQTADNAGATDEHRALNYCALRYPAVHAMVAQQHAENRSLSAVEVRRSRLSGTRKVVDVIFSCTHRTTDVVDKYFCRVDVTEEFPFLVTKMSPYVTTSSEFENLKGGK